MPDLRAMGPLTEPETLNLARLSQVANGVNIVLSADTVLPLAGGFRAEIETGVGQRWESTGAVEVTPADTFPDKVLGDGEIIPNPRILIGVEQTRNSGGPDSPSFRNVLCRLVLTPLDVTPPTFALSWAEV